MGIYEIYYEHEKVINEYAKKMTNDNYQETLSKIYDYVKSITYIYYDNGFMHKAYESLMWDMINTEDKLSDLKLLDIPTEFCFNNKKDNFIDYIVQNTREFLLKKHTYDEFNGNLSDIDFTNDCSDAASYVKRLCDKEKIKFYLLPIHPGYDGRARLYDGTRYHFANIIKYNNKYELVDVTYSQFFYKRRNNLDRLGIVNSSGCSVGTFMLMSEKGKNIATKLIHDGHIELNEEVFKTYLDSFTISFRNGLYYEDTNDFSYTALYSVDDYIKFLYSDDSQVKHEGRENLGYQKKPLKNYNLKFRR